MSSDVDALQAAICWFDARHGTSGDMDRVDRTLSDGNYIVSSSQRADNKQRVYEDDLSPNNSYSLRIFGEDVKICQEGTRQEEGAARIFRKKRAWKQKTDG